jgi:hypothetical protein
MIKANEALVELLKATSDDVTSVRENAQHEFAKAIETPLRDGVLYGDNLRNIFEPILYQPGQSIEYPLSFLAPGEEDEFVAFTSPGFGKIGEKKINGDFVTIPTYDVANSIQWTLKYARQANWPIVAKALQVMEAGFVKKFNDDGWHTILSAAADRNILVYDADASAGQFTKRLVSLMKTTMIRNGGGNTTSIKQSALTDIFLSPEALEDIRNWNVDQVDELTRREIYLAADDSSVITRIFGVNLHPMREFGEGQEYQLFWTNTLGATIQGSDTELVVGVDLVNRDSFVRPYTQAVQVWADPTLHRRGEEGYYSRGDVGFAVLDSRRVLAGSM